MDAGGGLRGKRVLCQHWVRLWGFRFIRSRPLPFWGLGLRAPLPPADYYIGSAPGKQEGAGAKTGKKGIF